MARTIESLTSLLPQSVDRSDKKAEDKPTRSPLAGEMVVFGLSRREKPPKGTVLFEKK